MHSKDKIRFFFVIKQLFAQKIFIAKRHDMNSSHSPHAVQIHFCHLTASEKFVPPRRQPHPIAEVIAHLRGGAYAPMRRYIIPSAEGQLFPATLLTITQREFDIILA